MDISGFNCIWKISHSYCLNSSYGQEEYCKQYSTGNAIKHLKDEDASAKCAVCSTATAPCNFYGAIACHACRSFFRRWAISKGKQRCKLESNCNITPSLKGTRQCGFCRFQKCLSVGMKLPIVQHNDRKSFYERVQAYDIFYRNWFQEKNCNIFDRKETSDGQSKLSADKNTVDSCIRNELIALSHSLPIASPIRSPKKPVLWVKELWSPPYPEELLKFQVAETHFHPCNSSKIVLNIFLDPESKTDEEFLQSLMIPSVKNDETVTSDSDTTFLSLQTTNRLVTFHREASSIFNVYVTTISKEESSIIIMESLNDNHWTRMKDIISFARILHQFTSVSHEVTTNSYPLDRMVHDLNQPVYTCILYTSIEKACDIVSKAIESLSFFPQLDIEDQVIILKDSFLSVYCLIYNHKYDKEAESYVSTTLDGRLSYCCHKDRFKIYPSNEHSEKLDQFYKSFLEKFLVFLRTDFLVISILSILCVLQENTGLSCVDTLEKERKYHCEILNAYITAKVISNEWVLDIDDIWRNIHEIFHEISKYPTIVTQFITEQKKRKSNF